MSTFKYTYIDQSESRHGGIVSLTITIRAPKTAEVAGPVMTRGAAIAPSSVKGEVQS